MKKAFLVLLTVLMVLGSAGMAFGRDDITRCPYDDGYQTVTFSDGATYSGYFKNCRPLEGYAEYREGSIFLKGHATPINDTEVELVANGYKLRISLVTEYYNTRY